MEAKLFIFVLLFSLTFNQHTYFENYGNNNPKECCEGRSALTN